MSLGTVAIATVVVIVHYLVAGLHVSMIISMSRCCFIIITIIIIIIVMMVIVVVLITTFCIHIIIIIISVVISWRYQYLDDLDN